MKSMSNKNKKDLAEVLSTNPFGELIKQIPLIESIKGTVFFNKILSLWEYAEKEIHPFQRGDSYQSSTHCYQVIVYIDQLSNLKSLNNLSELDKYLLCCSAILHDIDKATIEYDRLIKSRRQHGIKSAEFIRKHYNFFGFSRPEAEAISFIVNYHGDETLNNIIDECPIGTIEDPVTYKDFEIDFCKLSAIFRLADMMDLTYKRISPIIVKLNFKENHIDQKILSRMTFMTSTVCEKYILLKAYFIDRYSEYQAITSALDMINRDLEDTGMKTLLTDYKLPKYFKLDSPLINKKLTKIIAKRKVISDINEDHIIEIKDHNEDQLIEIFERYKNDFLFTPGELDQIKRKYKKLYEQISKRSVNDIKNEFIERFGYCFEKLKIERSYMRNGGIKIQFSYINLEKLKELAPSAQYSVYELAKTAKIDPKTVFLHDSDGTDYRNKNLIQFVSERELIFQLPNLRGKSSLEFIKMGCTINGAWCTKIDDFYNLYPNDFDFCESYETKISQPICCISANFTFPKGYKCFPICIYDFKEDYKEIEMIQNKSKSEWLVDVIQQNTDVSLDVHPKYKILWDIPE